MAIVVSENKFIDKLKRLGKGGLGKSMRDSMNWFKNKVKEIQGRALPAARKLRSELEDQGRLVAQPKLGQMYFYRYDPKFKDKLPYYDTYPLIFPFKYETSPNPGFWGINLHYLFLIKKHQGKNTKSQKKKKQKLYKKMLIFFKYPNLVLLMSQLSL